MSGLQYCLVIVAAPAAPVVPANARGRRWGAQGREKRCRYRAQFRNGLLSWDRCCHMRQSLINREERGAQEQSGDCAIVRIPRPNGERVPAKPVGEGVAPPGDCQRTVCERGTSPLTGPSGHPLPAGARASDRRPNPPPSDDGPASVPPRSPRRASAFRRRR